MEEISLDFEYAPIDVSLYSGASVKELDELEERFTIGALIHELRGLERTDRSGQDSYNDGYTKLPDVIPTKMPNLSRHYESSFQFTW